MASQIPLKTTSWRISPQEFRDLLHEADDQLSSLRAAYRDNELALYRQRVQEAQVGGISVEWAESNLRDAEERVENALRPLWSLVTKRQRHDTPKGSIDEVVPTIEMPGRYNYASVTLRGGEGNSIGITLSPVGPSITLSGTDEAWLRHAERWANEVLPKYRPRGWWLWTLRGGLSVVLLVTGAYVALAASLPLLGVPEAASMPIALAGEWAVLLAIFILVMRFRCSIIEPGPTRVKAFLTQAVLLAAGAVMGVFFTRIADILFP